jgi:hypothetical protein
MTSELDKETIRQHYERIAPVMEKLAQCGGNETIGLNDYAGWYVKREQNDFDLIDEGYDREGRCATLATDYDTVAGRIDRALYALTSYKDPDALRDWQPCTITDSETEWRDQSPTPGYGDLRGVMAWGDIDLVDELKPQRGDLDDGTRETIEATLSAYMDEFATLYGDRDAVYALDSVGGAYIMGAPAATLPIANLFNDDADARTRVMEAFVDRSNEWLKEAQQRVEGRVAGAADVIDPDWVNNCNRQYKAPLSLHTDHDAVVVPLSTEAPSYELAAFEDVDGDLIQAAQSWAGGLTGTFDDMTDCSETLVKRLWPDAYDDAGSWTDALESWVEAERQREAQEEKARQRARERRLQRKEQIDGGVGAVPITPHLSDIYDALDHLDIERVAEQTIASQWTDRATGKSDNSGSGKRAFIPTWGGSANSGNANYVDTENGIWVDTGDEYSGGPVKMALIANENWSRGDTPSGEDWGRGLEYLREAGFEIPIYTPDARSVDANGDDYEKMPYWAVRKAAVALGVLPEDAFIQAQNARGEGYEKFPGAETYNHALAAIEDAGLDHGREYMTDSGARPDDPQPEQSNDGVKPDETADSEESQAEGDAADADDADAESQTPPPTATNTSENDFQSFSELDRNDGGYGYWKSDESTGKTWYEPITNFTFDVDSFLFKDGERLIHMTVIPASGEREYDLTVSADVFNDARRFRDNVVTGLTTTFEGGPADLNELRKLVGGQDAPVRSGTHHMGLHPDSGEFVTPNGVLTADGWSEDPGKAYIEREIGAERAFGLSPDGDTNYDPVAVTEILERLPKSRFSQRFLPAMGWLYAAPLRPYIQDWEGQFNTLHVTGETGAGKSSTLSVLWQLLGMSGEPMACDDTKFALMTAMASTNSIPMWFDEYKPGDMKDWEVDRFQNLMRSTTRGGVATRGNADKSTEEYKLRAPLMISGEQSIQGPAEQRRTIQTRFKDGVKESGSPTKQAFAELTGMAYHKDGQTVEPDGYDLSQHALAYYRFILRQPPAMLKDLWADSRSYIRELFQTNGITGVDDLPRQGVQTIYFGMTLYRAFAEEMAGEAGMPADALDLPGSGELDEALLYIARQFGDSGSRKSHLDRFVELASRAATEGYLEADKHFTFVNQGQANEQLALKLSSVHDRVSKYVRDHGLDSEDLLNNAADYRDRMGEQADDADSYIITHSQKTPPLARCARLDTEMAADQLEFSRLAFGAEPLDEEDDGETSDDGTGPNGGGDAAHGATSIANCAESLTGYVTVTAEVLTASEIGESGVKLVLQDSTAAIDMVVWGGAAADVLAGYEGEHVVIKNAKVGEYDGSRQLQVAGGVTEVDTVQAGVGYTEAQSGTSNTLQSSSQPATDGGDQSPDADTSPEQSNGGEHEQAKPIVLDAVTAAVEANGNAPADDSDVLDQIDSLSETRVRDCIESLLADGIIQQMNGGYIPT